MDDIKNGIDGPILILEDDIRIESGAIKTINAMINLLPNTWEMLAVGYEYRVISFTESDSFPFLYRYKNGYCSGPQPHTTVSAPDDKPFCRARLFLDAHAYILRNATAVAHFLQFENRKEYNYAIDTIWVSLHSYP